MTLTPEAYNELVDKHNELVIKHQETVDNLRVAEAENKLLRSGISSLNFYADLATKNKISRV